MTTTVKVTYSAQGSPDTNLTFDFTGIDLENIKEELPQKKKELDSNLMSIHRKLALESTMVLHKY
jgi:hypothetical protein